MYELRYSRLAAKALLSMPKADQRRMRAALEAIARNPRNVRADATPMKGRKDFRLRIGDWRAVYDFQHDVMVVLVIKIGHRREIYR
jgi:mRNA interferase RelE/StbE